MAEEPRDGWSKFDVVARAVGVILLPLVLLIASNQYTREQRAADDVRYGGDRLATLTKSLASADPHERLVALEILQGSVRSNPKLVEILSPVLEDFARNGTEEEQQLAKGVLKSNFIQESRTNKNDSRPRLYLDICDIRQISKAEEAKLNLEKAGFQVLAVGSVPVGPPETTQVRYFHASEQAEAQRIAVILTKTGLRNSKEVYFSEYPTYPLRQYEVRFSQVALGK